MIQTQAQTRLVQIIPFTSITSPRKIQTFPIITLVFLIWPPWKRTCLLTIFHLKVWVGRSTILLTINTMHPCTNHRRRTARTLGLRTSRARIEVDIAQGNYSSVMLIGMSTILTLPGVADVDNLIVVPGVAVVEQLADDALYG